MEYRRDSLPAPIVLFVYSRPESTQLVVEALRKNKMALESELYVFSDGWKGDSDKDKVIAVRDVIKKVDGFKKVHLVERPANKGLACSVIEGVTEVINKHGEAIVLEDDIITSPMFLSYMNHSLQKYRDESKVFSVTGYNIPYHRLPALRDYKDDVYFGYRSHSWSWATWKDRWEGVDWGIADRDAFFSDKKAVARFCRGGGDLAHMLRLQLDGKIDSWAIRFVYAQFRASAFCVYPKYSLVDNIGFGVDATHCQSECPELRNTIDPEWLPRNFPQKIEVDAQITSQFKKMFRNFYLEEKSHSYRVARKFFNSLRKRLVFLFN